MKQLIAYLLDHAIIDFSGDLTLDMVRDFLREDDSPEGRKLLGKLVEDRGVDDMVVTLADCLQDYLRTRHHRRGGARADPPLQRELVAPRRRRGVRLCFSGSRTPALARERLVAPAPALVASGASRLQLPDRRDPVSGACAPAAPGRVRAPTQRRRRSDRRRLSHHLQRLPRSGHRPLGQHPADDRLLLGPGDLWRRPDRQGGGGAANPVALRGSRLFPAPAPRAGVAGGLPGTDRGDRVHHRDGPAGSRRPRRRRCRVRAGDLRREVRGAAATWPPTAGLPGAAGGGPVAVRARRLERPGRRTVAAGPTSCGWSSRATGRAATCCESCCPRPPEAGADPGVSGQREPPGDPLPEDQLRLIAAWIDGGAPR